MRPLVFLGDEDRAKDHCAEALAFADSVPAGRGGGFSLSDGTTIRVDDYGIYVHAEFLPESVIVLPRNIGGGLYNVELYGCNHRKDAMIPKGVLRAGLAYVDTFPPLGPEICYISDGIVATTMAYPYFEYPPTISDAAYFVTSVSIAGGDEDYKHHGEGVGTVGGFSSVDDAVASVAAYRWFADSFYSVNPYGVSRSSPDTPYYQFALGSQYEYGAEVTEQYASGAREVKYAACYQLLPLIGTGKGATKHWSTTVLCSDIVVHWTTYGYAVSACFPIVIPLGNERVMALTRKRTADGSKWFGGTFSIEAYIASGTNAATVTASTTAGLTSGFMRNVWDFGAENYNASSIAVPLESQKHYWLFRSLAMSSRNAVALSQNETVLAAHKTYLDQLDPTDPGNTIPASSTHSEQWVCLSATPSGITVKGVIKSYWGETTDPGGAPHGYNYKYGYIGTVGTSTTDVLAYFERRKSTVENGYTFVWDGLVRFASSDGGATWDAGTDITEPVGLTSYMISPPVYLGRAIDDKAVIAFAVTKTTPGSGSAFSINEGTVWHSEDDGINFTLSTPGAINLGFEVNDTAYIFHRMRGLSSMHYCGNSEDGFAPSPHPYLPDYYGTPTKASRSITDDPNL